MAKKRVDIDEELDIIASEPRGALVKDAIYSALNKLNRADLPGGDGVVVVSGIIMANTISGSFVRNGENFEEVTDGD